MKNHDRQEFFPDRSPMTGVLQRGLLADVLHWCFATSAAHKSLAGISKFWQWCCTFNFQAGIKFHDDVQFEPKIDGRSASLQSLRSQVQALCNICCSEVVQPSYSNQMDWYHISKHIFYSLIVSQWTPKKKSNQPQSPTLWTFYPPSSSWPPSWACLSPSCGPDHPAEQCPGLTESWKS